MNNKNSGRKAVNCYEDESENMKNNNYNFELEFDMNGANDCSIKDMEKNNNENCEDSEEAYIEGFKDGYERAVEEVLVYMKKNKCFKRCKHNCKRRCTHKK